MNEIVEKVEKLKEEKMNEIVEIVEKLKEEKINVKTIRHTFSSEVVEKLKEFSILHQYEKSKEYRESWKQWTNNEMIKELLDRDIGRLVEAGMNGDIMDRMYKSSRYYYRKNPKTDEPKIPKERKEYEGLPRNMLRDIDNMILCEMIKNIKDGLVLITPQTLYEKYILDNKSNIEEINFTTTEDKMNKLKKTFKNRFYTMKVKIQKK